ncbi:MAG: hypothetical protein GY772_01930 [bacterium]|nr:hypothetical protein [bacterium]
MDSVKKAALLAKLQKNLAQRKAAGASAQLGSPHAPIGAPVEVGSVHAASGASAQLGSPRAPIGALAQPAPAEAAPPTIAVQPSARGLDLIPQTPPPKPEGGCAPFTPGGLPPASPDAAPAPFTPAGRPTPAISRGLGPVSARCGAGDASACDRALALFPPAAPGPLAGARRRGLG